MSCYIYKTENIKKWLQANVLRNVLVIIIINNYKAMMLTSCQLEFESLILQ